MCSLNFSCAVVHPISSLHEQASEVMSYPSKANLRVRQGWDCTRLWGTLLKIVHLYHNNIAKITEPKKTEACNKHHQRCCLTTIYLHAKASPLKTALGEILEKKVNR